MTTIETTKLIEPLEILLNSDIRVMIIGSDFTHLQIIRWKPGLNYYDVGPYGERDVSGELRVIIGDESQPYQTRSVGANHRALCVDLQERRVVIKNYWKIWKTREEIIGRRAHFKFYYTKQFFDEWYNDPNYRMNNLDAQEYIVPISVLKKR